MVGRGGQSYRSIAVVPTVFSIALRLGPLGGDDPRYAADDAA
jgi:hypothetical protein